MTPTRRKALADAINLLGNALPIVQSAHEDEQEDFAALSESAQEGEKGETMSTDLDTIAEAIDSLQEAIDKLGEVVSG